MSKNESGNFDGGRASKSEKKREQWGAYWLSEYRRWLKLGVRDSLSSEVADVTAFLIGLRARKKAGVATQSGFACDYRLHEKRIRCGIALRHIYLSRERTFGPFRCCWGTRTFRQL